MDKLLIVDDDAELCELLADRLSAEGLATECAHDGQHGLERALSGDHAFVVLDLMLPGIGGLDVLRRLRARSTVPVLILTARGEDVERILGLELGADDYLPKPFNPLELIARIRAILRRIATPASHAAAAPLIVGDLRLDPAAREVRLRGAGLSLTSVEFTLLEMLLRHAGQVVSREQLTETVLGRKLGPFDRVIDVHVSNIRKKLGSNHAGERIKSVRGAGYLFVPRVEASGEAT
jgi:DNA-binding response OmpR family regulator